MPSPISWLRLLVIDKAEFLELIHRADNLPVSVKPRPVALRPLVVGFRARVGCRPPLPYSFRVKSQSNGSRVLQAFGRPKGGGDPWPDDFGLPPKAKWNLRSEVFEDRSPWMRSHVIQMLCIDHQSNPICGSSDPFGTFRVLGCRAIYDFRIFEDERPLPPLLPICQLSNACPACSWCDSGLGQFCQGRLYSRSSRATACSNVSPSPQPC